VVFKRTITTALVVAAAAAAPPTAFAMLDSVPPPPSTQDLRSPDARPEPPVIQDLRSPDARDAGRVVVVSERPPVSGPVGRTVDVTGAEFPWLEAGLAATLALALVIFGTGTMRRRRPATSG
jgi:hypothetical protein